METLVTLVAFGVILLIVGIALDVAADDSPHALLMTADERVERGAVAAAKCLDEVAVRVDRRVTHA